MSDELGPKGSRPRVAVTTLGCKVNQYDSETLLGAFAQAGYDVVPSHEDADVYIINTCVVTGRAAAKSRQLVHRVAREHPEAVVAVAGCYPQTERAEVLDIPGVDVVIGTRDRDRLVELVEQARQSHRAAPLAAPPAGLRLTPPDSDGEARPWSYEELPIAEFHGRTRATVKIQEGCEQFCSYCVIPYARGPVRSRRPEDVVAEVRRLAAAGFKEVVLTGIHLGAYGRDLGAHDPDLAHVDLAAVVGRLAGLPGLARVRLSSIEPMEITPALVDLVVGGVLCRHLHVPLQSGAARTLAAMNRHYTPDDYRRVVDAARARLPGLAVSTDIMVGFPGETEADFEDSLAFARSMGFSRLHVFKYSRRRGTPAVAMPGQVPAAAKAARSARLITLGEEMGLAFVRGQLGTVAEVLVEGEAERGRLEGLTDNYIRVLLDGPAEWQNELVRVTLEAATAPGEASGRAGDISEV
ncbi:MAG: tRNA (N(6)-L-threonylcarbamoyladenosine(37)-C(2))-methylthiotransferase MtaB [Bacillota bacterium]